MKVSEMDYRQKKAYKNVYWATRDYIGGLENGVSDNAGTDVEKDYQEALSNHQHLVDTIYQMAITDIYDEGSVSCGDRARSLIRDIRFCGKDWIMERVERQVKKLGY